MNAISRRVSKLERQGNAVSFAECIEFVDQLGADLPDCVPTTPEGREAIARDVERKGGPAAYMREILDEIDGKTAHLEGCGCAAR